MEITYDYLEGTKIGFPPEENEDAIMFLLVMAEGFRQMDKLELAQKIRAAIEIIEAAEPPKNGMDS